jgi:hypothetical protein
VRYQEREEKGRKDIPGWQLCDDLDLSVANTRALARGEPRALYGVDDGASRSVAHGRARAEVRRLVPRLCGIPGIRGLGRGVTDSTGYVVGAVCEVEGVTVEESGDTDDV